MKDISKFSADELKAELKRRAEEALRVETAQRRNENDMVVKYIDVLLSLTPKHTPNRKCSDINPAGDKYGGCMRCAFIEIKKDGYMDTDLELEIALYNNPLSPKV